MNIEFDNSDLDQFPPAVQEALMRLARQQDAARERERLPFRGVQLRPGADRMTEDDYRRQAASQETADGGRMQPDLAEGPQVWRPK